MILARAVPPGCPGRGRKEILVSNHLARLSCRWVVKAGYLPESPPPNKRPILKNAQEKTHNRYDYTKGSIGWGITRLSVPMCVEQVIRNIDGILEVYWIGRLGPEFLAATSLGFMVILFLRSFGFGVRIAGQALVAQRIGAKDSEGASAVAGQAIFILLSYALVFTLIGFVFSPYIMALMTSDPVILQLGTAYIRAGFAVFVVWEGMFAFSNILRGAGEPGYTLVAMIAGACLSVVAVPLLIFGAGPVPAIGIAGGFLGMGVGRLTSWMVMLYFVAAGRSRVKVRFRDLRPDPGIIWRLIGLAWPVSTQNLLERGANLILLRMLSPFGTFALAAWAVGNRVTLMARMPSFGLQGSVRTLVGQNMGAGFPGRAIRTVKLALGALIVFVGIVSLGLFFFAPEVVTVFGMKGKPVGVGAMALRILSVGLLMESARRVVAGAFQGSGQTKPPMLVEGIVRWAFQLPVAFLMIAPLGVGAASIWLAISGSQILSGMTMLIWFFLWARSGGLASCSATLSADLVKSKGVQSP